MSNNINEQRTRWLPDGWSIRFKQRTGGATAGRVDKFYIDPTGCRQFRSKVKVLSFLQTGRRRSKKPNRELTTLLKWGKKKRTGPTAQPPPREVNWILMYDFMGLNGFRSTWIAC